ncbi:23S rRNA (pseudouridine(1915)-N(3))-methyltransferase RlmH [Martelella endophytica]|uniref:Ribosomal RNA large subunit methyltransferase H n=1 Tax=Martelella endophytica TaxID=1486262 RepID=A0A0D5LMF4_MAREN|nr:23S rRNA (pseudouridine(1915)-N(3))-methyltransferase RlmH [Martelella endophytica]AJY44488.1 50S rRNA methyltransferase [Martelella endophytica]
MQIGIFAVGRLKSGPEKDLVARYLDRLKKTGKAQGLDFSKVTEINESRAGNAATRKREEAAALENILSPETVLALLDEHGKSLDSLGFAGEIEKFRDNGKREMIFAIGGADGLDPALTERADLVINFGNMTWPHQIVRILLAEQLYRAVTLMAGHPYHRA